MILTSDILVIVNNNRINLYRDYFQNMTIKQGDELLIPIELLSENSRLKINVKCDVCGHEKYVMYHNYIKSVKNMGIYCCCPNCAKFKNVNTCLNKYGVDSVMKVDIFKENLQKTILLKYDVTNISKRQDIKDKKKQTFIKNYGVENISQTEYWRNIICKKDLREFIKYKNKVYRLTQKIKRNYLKIGMVLITMMVNILKKISI